MSISGPMRCPCCGDEEKLTGCLRGILCDCDSRPQCELCKHCVDHHIKNCTDQARAEMTTIGIPLIREKYKINIFDIGERRRETIDEMRARYGQ